MKNLWAFIVLSTFAVVGLFLESSLIGVVLSYGWNNLLAKELPTLGTIKWIVPATFYLLIGAWQLKPGKNREEHKDLTPEDAFSLSVSLLMTKLMGLFYVGLALWILVKCS